MAWATQEQANARKMPANLRSFSLRAGQEYSRTLSPWLYSSCATHWILGCTEDDGPMWPLRGLLAFSHRHISPQRRRVGVVLLW